MNAMTDTITIRLDPAFLLCHGIFWILVVLSMQIPYPIIGTSIHFEWNFSPLATKSKADGRHESTVVPDAIVYNVDDFIIKNPCVADVKFSATLYGKSFYI